MQLISFERLVSAVASIMPCARVIKLQLPTLAVQLCISQQVIGRRAAHNARDADALCARYCVQTMQTLTQICISASSALLWLDVR